MQHTTTQPRMAAITHLLPVVKRSTFVIAFAAFGVASILAGLVNSLSANLWLSKASTPSFVNASQIDGAYNFVLGLLIIASSVALVRGRMLALWLYGGSILLDICFNLIMGYPLNYLFIGFGLLMLWQTTIYKGTLRLS